MSNAADMPWFAEWCIKRGLTKAERRVLWTATGGKNTQADLAVELGVARSTIKKQCSDICFKLSTPSLKDAVVMVLREALTWGGRQDVREASELAAAELPKVEGYGKLP